eukprot:TRINITY_DN912_c0_g1_i6.p1 TRINITY_DN912_c0_g1~~TRINITY_DN912_c0_g1_i6.p1  ORF type:complete len:171 (-),score=28.67 TRINITY_DN912_c0_g1_i6:8-520(-)
MNTSGCGPLGLSLIIFSSLWLVPILLALDPSVALKIVRMGNSPFAAFVALVDAIAIVFLWVKTTFSGVVLVCLLVGVFATTVLLLILEAIDAPFLLSLLLAPISVVYGVGLLRFYMAGAILSDFLCPATGFRHPGEVRQLFSQRLHWLRCFCPVFPRDRQDDPNFVHTFL